MKLWERDWSQQNPENCMACSFGCKTLFIISDDKPSDEIFNLLGRCGYCLAKDLADQKADVIVASVPELPKEEKTKKKKR